MITCAKCGGKVGVTGPCRTCKRRAKAAMRQLASRPPVVQPKVQRTMSGMLMVDGKCVPFSIPSPEERTNG